MKRYTEVGKLSNDELDALILSKLERSRTEVLSGSSIGEDTAVLDLESDLVVLSSDPITGAADHLGSLAIHISVNDVATKSADAVGVLLTLLLPVNATSAEIETIMDDAQRASREVKMDIVGGHTEITEAVTKPVMISTVIGRVKRGAMPKPESIRPGDVVCMSKYAGLEGTAILTSDFEVELAAIGGALLNEGKALTSELSVQVEGEVAAKYRVGYMHDVTEGGIEGALWEAAHAIGWGMSIDKDAIPIHPATQAIAEAIDIDIYRLISSGSMLIVMAEEDYPAMARELQDRDIAFTQIGTVTDSTTMQFLDGTPIAAPGPDELFSAIAQLQ